MNNHKSFTATVKGIMQNRNSECLKDTCVLYSKDKKRCNALNATYCEVEGKCSFYKRRKGD